MRYLLVREETHCYNLVKHEFTGDKLFTVTDDGSDNQWSSMEEGKKYVYGEEFTTLDEFPCTVEIETIKVITEEECKQYTKLISDYEELMRSFHKNKQQG